MTVRFTPMPGLREDPAVAGSSSPVIVLFHNAAPDQSTLSLWTIDIASGQDAPASERAEWRYPLLLHASTMRACRADGRLHVPNNTRKR